MATDKQIKRTSLGKYWAPFKTNRNIQEQLTMLTHTHTPSTTPGGMHGGYIEWHLLHVIQSWWPDMCIASLQYDLPITGCHKKSV